MDLFSTEGNALLPGEYGTNLCSELLGSELLQAGCEQHT